MMLDLMVCLYNSFYMMVLEIIMYEGTLCLVNGFIW